MAKQDTIYSCSKCDAQFSKWQGRCPECGAWGSLLEGQTSVSAGQHNKANTYPDTAQVINFSEVTGKNAERMKIGMDEVDRVLGGGIVPGSLILLGGEPGIGKSTLVLQIAEKLMEKRGWGTSLAKDNVEGHINDTISNKAIGRRDSLILPEKDLSTLQTSSGDDICSGRNDKMSGAGILYASGEESAEQIKLRIDRMGINPQDIHFLGETNTEVICGAILKYRPSLVIIDSIQMLYSDDVDSEPGSVNQIRASAAKLMGVAKHSAIESGLPQARFRGRSKSEVGEPRFQETGMGDNIIQCHPAIIIIGHITKDGAVAGPKTLEHLVDTVLYLEGERYYSYRLLRTVKNRFGSTNEVGVFEMQSKGLQEVKNPSSLFMEEHQENLPGTIVTCVMEGTRPFLVEIQALTAATTFGYPQRKVSGYDLNRLQLLLAVLQKRLGLNFSNKDVYLNVVGGFKIQEPSADLAICLALISVLKNQPLQVGTVAFGEVGLGGEIRAVSQTDKRINEASKLGFKNIICPRNKKTGKSGNLEAGTLEEVIKLIFKIDGKIELSES